MQPVIYTLLAFIGIRLAFKALDAYAIYRNERWMDSQSRIERVH